MIDAYKDNARETCARILHSCGHDSIPPELGVQFLKDAALARHGNSCKRATTRVTRMKGGFSGGTAASFLNAMRLRETGPDFGRLPLDPYALCPEDQRDGPDGLDRMMPVQVTWDADLKAWTKPYFMGPVNAKVVRHSNAIMGYPYGCDFSYDETALTHSGIGGWWTAMRDTLFGRLFLTTRSIPATRRLLQRRVLPKTGEGPSKEVLETGSYEIVQVGEMPDGAILMARITSQGDPGVWSTTLMPTEAALCLAEDESKIPVGRGVWTSASVMGKLLQDRVTEHAAQSFEMIEDLRA